MMPAKTTIVTLVANGVTQDFEFAHAERLLQMPRNGGWMLPEGSRFEFKDNALLCRRNTGKDTKE